MCDTEEGASFNVEVKSFDKGMGAINRNLVLLLEFFGCREISAHKHKVVVFCIMVLCQETDAIVHNLILYSSDHQLADWIPK